MRAQLCPEALRTEHCVKLNLAVGTLVLAPLVTRRGAKSGLSTVHSGASEVDVSLLHVSSDEFGANFVTHIESLLALR